MTQNNKAYLSSGEKLPYVKAIITGAIFGSLLIIFMLCIAAVVFLKSGTLPTQVITYFIIAFNAAGGFVAGYIAARITKMNGMLLGMATGIAIFILMVIGGFAINQGSTITALTLYKALALIVFGVIGGIKGVNKKEKVRF